MKRLLCPLLAIGLLTAVQAQAGSSLPPYTPAATPVTRRAPLPSDDWSKGYAAQGTVQAIVPTALGSGYTAANTSAALSGGGCTSFGALSVGVYAGTVVGIRPLAPTEGCTSAPTVTITGDGTGAAATAYTAAVGAAWIDPSGVYYRMLRDTPGQAVWQRQFMPSNALAADVVPGALWAVGEDRLHAGATKALNLAGGVNAVAGGSTAGDIGFVGNLLDYGALDAFMGGTAATLNTFYDQIGTNNAAGQSSPGTLAALTVKTGGSGYTNGAAVTFTNLPCTTQPTATALVTSGAITGFTITGAGSKCSISGVNGSITSASVAGGTGATFAIQIAGQPAISALNLVGNGGRVDFNSTVETNGQSGNYLSPAGTVKFKQGLTIPSGVATTTSGYTLVALIACGQSTKDVAIVALSGTTKFDLGQSLQTKGLRDSVGSSGLTVANNCPVSGRVIGVANSAATINVWTNDGTDYGTRGGLTLSTLAGGTIGCGTVLTDGNGDTDCGNVAVRALILFGRPLAATEFQQVAVALDRAAGLFPQVRLSDVGDGDSITEGAYGSFFQSWPRLMAAQLSQPVVQYDTAVSGQTATADVATIPTWIGLCARPGTTIYHNAVGTNDIPAGTAATAIEASVTTLLGSVQAAGCGPLYLATILPRGTFNGNSAYEAVRLAVNTWERANAGVWSAGLVDVANDPSMGTTANVTNTAFYQDQTHPGYVWNGGGEGQGGYPYLAALHAAPVNAYLKTLK